MDYITEGTDVGFLNIQTVNNDQAALYVIFYGVGGINASKQHIVFLRF